MRRKGFTKLTPKAGRVSSTFLLPPELIWGSPYARGLRYHLPFRGPIRLTNYIFHVQYNITIHYHSCSIDKYRNVEDPKCHNFGRFIWAQVNWTQVCTTLDHQMPLPGGTSELRSTGPKLVPLLATRCLYCRVHLTEGQPDPKADQMSRWPDVTLLLVTRCLYQGDTSELRSTGPNVVLVLATRCLYQGVHLTEGQPDPKPDQMSSWPEIVPFLATRCLYGGYIWTQSTGPNLVLVWATKFLYQGYVRLNVSLTQRLAKCQDDLM